MQASSFRFQQQAMIRMSTRDSVRMPAPAPYLQLSTAAARSIMAAAAICLVSACSRTPWYDDPPVQPMPLSPAPGAVLLPGDTTFTWSRTAQTESYDFHVFNDETKDIDRYMLQGLNPATICAADTCSISLQLALPDSSRHAWRVRASNVAGKSAWTRSLFTFSGAAVTRSPG